MSDPLHRLLEIMEKLRDPAQGCPWDQEQTFRTIAPHTIEEAYEVADAIEQRDMGALKDELGDLLFQVVYHAQMAREDGHFGFDDVAAAICEKMIRRHPHVFGDAEVATAEAQTRAWEEHKAAERRAKAAAAGTVPTSALDGVTRGLPSLTRALKLQKRAARIGFDWPDAVQAGGKLSEEIDELLYEVETDAPAERLTDELGDVLFCCVNLARKLDLDPEAALRHANAKFERRFRRVESLLTERGRDPDDASLEEMDGVWNVAKAEERGE